MMKPPVKNRTAATTASQFENMLAEKNDSPTPETRMTPITNVLIATLLFGLAQTLHPTGLVEAMLVGALINAFMAVFNLIPFGVLDGLKVFRWSKPVWLVLFALAALVTGLSYMAL